MTFKWENPPKRREVVEEKPQPSSAVVAERLRNRPGRWARVRQFDNRNTAYVYANTISHGRTRAFEPAGSFEAVSRKNGQGVHVYARFVGEE